MSGGAHARTLFITGTDTGVGKTFVSCALLRRARSEGLKACGFKPVASGCERTREGLRNEDALALQEAAATFEPYELINPCAYEPAIAPHLAARAAGSRIQVSTLDHAHAQLTQRHELIVAEGAGGWLVPLNEDLSFAAWVEKHNWPVILVVGMRLGCINHALLSADNIMRRTRLAGWIANTLSPEMPHLQDNIAEIRERIAAPLLGVIPANCDPLRAAQLVGLPPSKEDDEDEGLP